MRVSRLLNLLALVVFVAALQVQAFRHLPPPPRHDASGLLVFDGLLLILVPMAPVIHELGHAVVGIALRLRVVHFRIAVRRGVSHVQFAPPADAWALPARMVTALAAGPAANLLTAAAAFAYDQRQTNRFVHVALLGAYVVWAYTGLANLVPFHSHAGPSDGLRIVLWTAQPTRMRQELAARYRVAAMRQRVAAINRGAEDARLDTIIATADDPASVLAAAGRRWARDNGVPTPEMIQDGRRLAAMASSPHTHPALASAMATFVAALLGNAYLRSAVVRNEFVPPSTVHELAVLAELGLRYRPDAAPARVSVAIIRLLQHRPADARGLLVGYPGAETDPGVVQAVAVVRAVAEAYLGELSQAKRLYRVAADTGCDDEDLSFITAAMGRPKVVRQPLQADSSSTSTPNHGAP